MGIDTAIYRILIGTFYIKSKRNLKSKASVSLSSKRQLTTRACIIATWILILTILICAAISLPVLLSFINRNVDNSFNIGNSDIKTLGETASAAEIDNLLSSISFHDSLLLAGDVELNPGPINDEREDKILKAIKDSELKLPGRIDSLDIEINSIKSERSQVKQQFRISQNEI
jgi:hypothetical protein